MLTLYVNKWPVCKALNYVGRETRLRAPAADEVTRGGGGAPQVPADYQAENSNSPLAVHHHSSVLDRLSFPEP